MVNAPLRVVYLAGSGHTGSTLLALLMDVHPRIASVGEVAVKPKIRRRGDELDQKCSCGAFVSACDFWRRIFSRVNEAGFAFAADNWTNDYRCEHPLLHRVLTRDSSYRPVRAFQGWATYGLPFYRGRVRRIDSVNVAFIRAVLEVAGADVFFDASKQPMRLSRLFAIPELDVRVVSLVRDVRAYAASAKKRGKPVSDAAETWKHDQEVIGDAIARLPRDRTLLLRYEDLCTQSEHTMAKLWDFCGVERIQMPASVLSHDHHVLGNNMRMTERIEIRFDERWKQTLAEREQAEVLHIAGELNQQFGYV